jgi:hypothetical protein
VGAVDQLRSWGRNVRRSPWLAVGIAAGALLVLAWIGWAIHVSSDHGVRQGLGVLVAWPAIAAALALISIPFIWAFRVIRASIAGSGEHHEEGDEAEEAADSEESESASTEVTETG